MSRIEGHLQGPEQDHLLLHATRQLRRHRHGVSLEPDERQRFHRRVKAFSFINLLHLEPICHVVDDVSVREQRKVLEYHPHLAAYCLQRTPRQGLDINIVNPDTPGCDRMQLVNGSDRCGTFQTLKAP